MKRQQLKGSLMLLLTAIIWGCAFVAQSAAMDSVGPFTFQATRSLLGAVVLIPIILVMDKKKKNDQEHIEHLKNKKTLLIGGVVCGVILCAASNLQQFGIVTTDPGKAGFITAMYILLVPVLGLFIGKKVQNRLWLCIVIAAAGLYFLCINGSFSLASGDILVILCAVVFSFHILAVDKFSPITDGVRLSCIQFFVCSLISGILMLIFEKPELNSIIAAAVPILYAGIGSCGIAYTLQILGQKYTPPTIASLIMSLESVFAVIAQIVILRIVPSGREIIGCILMFAAIIISQLPERQKNSAQTDNM